MSTSAPGRLVPPNATPGSEHHQEGARNMPTETTVERTVQVGSRVGLHARPAAAVVELAATLPAVVTIAKGDGAPADTRSLLSLIALGAECGDEVTLRAEGDGAEASVGALAELISSDQDA